MTNKMNSFLEKLKEKVAKQENYGGGSEESAAKMGALQCPNCGAGRAEQDGLTHCAYCRHEFISVTLSDGIYIKQKDN